MAGLIRWKRLLAVFFFILLHGDSICQSPVLAISGDSIFYSNVGIRLYDLPWKWHPGDDSTWKKADFSDDNWANTSTLFGETQPLKNWTGIGWFRLKLKLHESLAGSTLALRLNHDGASEIFWDERKIGGYGTVGLSEGSMKAETGDRKLIPLFADTQTHVLAIRYSNFNAYFPRFIGFQAYLGNYKTMAKMNERRAEDHVLSLISIAIQLTLAFFHLILFFFYRKQRLNLYYSLFVFAFGIGLFFKETSTVSEFPAIQNLADYAFIFCFEMISLTGGMLMYGLVYNEFPAWRTKILYAFTLINIGVYLLVLLLWGKLVSDFFFRISVVLFFLIVMTDGVIGLIKVMGRGGRRELWLIASGMFILCLASTIVGANLLGHVNSDVVAWTMDAATLVMPLCFSIYLAMDIARTNRNLATQLTENQVLAMRNLEQEQEKTKLISEQAEQLEKTVAERTHQVRQQADRLKEMDAVKSRFFVNITHDFRTPLALILGPTEAILKQSVEKSIIFQAGLIRNNASRLLTLINQLLSLSKLEEGKMEYSPLPVDIKKLTEELLMSFHSLAEVKNISIAFKMQAEVCWCVADRHKLQMILQNLVSNAIKFSKTGTNVLVSWAECEGHGLSLSVADNGIGIPEAKLPYIFDRFYQVDATDTRRQEGTGVGLALTHELVKLMGGSIQVQSEPGKGSKFVIFLPLARSSPIDSDDNTGLGESQPFSTADPSHEMNPILKGEDEPLINGKPTIVVAEDNPELRTFILSILVNHYQVIEAGNGREGLELTSDLVPDLLLTDLMMPEMDGYDLTASIKENPSTSHVPVVMLTARADTNSRIDGWDVGADGYLAKPFEAEELLAMLSNLIGMRRKLAEKFGRELIADGAVPGLAPVEQVFLKQVMQTIEEYLDDPQLSVDFLCEKVGLSRTHLHRKLKALVDQSPGEMIRLIRLQKALTLLRQRAGTVSEIAYMVGFGNPANFSTSFSKHFGFAPSEVSKN